MNNQITTNPITQPLTSTTQTTSQGISLKITFPTQGSFSSATISNTVSSILDEKTRATAVKVVNLIPILIPMRTLENTQTIIQGIHQAIANHKNTANYKEHHLMIHTPEMSITGYDCGDLFQTDPMNLNDRIQASLKQITQATTEASVSIGFPYYTNTGERVILHAIVSEGKIVSIKGKEELANNIGRNRGVEYEARYFVPCKAGTTIRFFGRDYTYEVGSRSEGNIFSNSPVTIAGQRISMVICEEMFTGTDRLDDLGRELEKTVSAYMETILKQTVPGHHIQDTEYSALRNSIYSSLEKGSEAKLEMPKGLKIRFNTETIQSFEHAFETTFSQFRQTFNRIKTLGETQVKKDIQEKNMLVQQLKSSDVALIPNGSPSAAGKYNTREKLLTLIGEAMQEGLVDGEPVKRVFYNNHNGTQAGSISFDGSVIKAEYSKEAVKVSHLSTYHHGLVEEAASERPHWTTAEGLREITNAVNGTEYYSGKQKFQIQFGDVVKNVYPRFYQEVEYAYSNLLKHIGTSVEQKPGEMFERGSKKYVGNFISLSGGFDSAHTLIVRALSFAIRMRTLVKEKGSVLTSLYTMIGELKLDQREFDLNLFCTRFLLQKVNTEDSLDNTQLTYKNLERICKALRLNSTITESNLMEKVAEAKTLLQSKSIATIAQFLEIVSDQMDENSDEQKNEEIELLSRLITFHTVKASYLRTENNSTKTEKAARTLAHELGVDFELRNVDVDYKTALLLEKGVDLSKFAEKDRIEILNIYNEIMRVGKKSDREDHINELEAKKRIIQDGRSKTQYTVSPDEIGKKIAFIKEEIAADTARLTSLKAKLQEKIRSSATGEAEHYQNYIANVHNWFESDTGLEIENIQARVRSEKNWEMAAQMGFMPTSNPNTDEGKQGYTTFIGDLHAGKESSTADLRKTEILAEMALIMNKGLHDSTQFFGEIPAVKAIYNTFTQPPSAELQQCGTDALFSQQTDEDSYGMSYFVLSLVGDKLFELSNNGAHFVHISEVFERIENHPVFHGHTKWEIYSKIDKVYRQWYFAAFKRRAAPWQMTNSDVSVDHHANNRIEFAGFDNATRLERTELLLTLLLKEGIIQGDQVELKKALLLNTNFQNELGKILWNREAKPDDIKVLIKRYAENPELLKILIQERVQAYAPALLQPEQFLEIKAPALSGSIPQLDSSPIAAMPITTKARDLAGNLENTKKALLIAHANKKKLVVIPDVIGTDLGDNVRRVSQEDINILVENLKGFSKIHTPGIAVVIGHPTYDERSTDRSCRYYQSASVIKDGEILNTFHASKIDNNQNRPGASYNTRTFQAYLGSQTAVKINGQSYVVLIGESPVPQSLHGSGAKVIHIGAMEAEDQLEAAQKIGENLLACSVNATGSSSGIRSFNGRVINNVNEIPAFKALDAQPIAQLEKDATWMRDYLPPFRVTINLDSPEALYTLKVMKRCVELRTGVFNQENFNKFAEVVTPYYKGEKQEMDHLWSAANAVLGFEIPKTGLDRKKNPRSNMYEIDSFKYMFLKNTLIGDINIDAFAKITNDDTWLSFEKLLKGYLVNGAADVPEMLKSMELALKGSAVFRYSLAETYKREQITLNGNGKHFQRYANMQIELIVDRIKNYYAHPETADRLKSIFGWLLSARDGGEGQIILANIARNDLCCAQQDLFGGRIHAGGISVTTGRSLSEMRDVFDEQGVKDVFTRKMKEEIASGLTRENVDAIFTYLVDNSFTLKGIEEANAEVFPQRLSDDQKLATLEKFISLWELNVWDRHAIPNSPHTKYSVDQQTSFREPLHSTWLRDQLSLVKRRMEQLRQL